MSADVKFVVAIVGLATAVALLLILLQVTQ
jgi:hypothetical protein